ncbi:MAG: magnesium transporter [Anaerolineae bacterium]|nr:magnesium transporter [Anaerolineae bacterium]
MSSKANYDLTETFEHLVELLDAEKFSEVDLFLKQEHPADIADLLEMLDDAHRLKVFESLHLNVAAEVLDEARTDTLQELVEALSDDKLADLLEAMPSDDAAEILSEIDEEQAEAIIALMTPAEAIEVEKLLAYEEDTAGRLMATNIVRLVKDWTIAQTLEYLRSIDLSVETLAYLYVVDTEGKLVGIIPIWKLLTAQPQEQLAQIMQTSVITVTIDTDQEEVARVVSQYDFFAVPVVDPNGKLMGIVTHDDVIDVINDEFTEDAQRFGGSQPLEGSYFSTPIWIMVRKRVGWLLLLFLTAQFTTSIMGIFQADLESVVALSFFVPLLIGTGGNAGSQMTATMIRAVAMNEVRFEDTWRVVGREFLTGAWLGLLMAVASFALSAAWGNTPHLAITLALALLVVVIWANLMGVMLPITAARVKIDPTVISGPVMSTLVDATGLLIYFMLARLILAEI